MFPKQNDIELPETIEAAVDLLLADLPLLDHTRLSAMTDVELEQVNLAVGRQIVRDFRLWSGNDLLLKACLDADGDREQDPSMVIIRAMWQKLQQTHVLRVIK